MLARGTLGQWAAAKTSARDLPQLARFLHQTLAARNASALPAARALTRAYRAVLDARRSYATTTATKPTATVKKAVKAQVAAKPAPKKTAAASATKTTKAVKKPVKKPAKKATAAKAKAKAKPKAKKKVAPKKPAPKKRVKKVLTPEEKEKAKIRQLRQLALKEPGSRASVSAYNAYISDRSKGQTGSNAPRLAELSKGYAALTPAEREHYNHLANQATAAKVAEYQAWIYSHTPAQIHTANLARNQLRSKLKPRKAGGAPRYTKKLVDDRRFKRPAIGFSAFLKERHATGDLKGIQVKDSIKVIAEEWKALSGSEKKKYKDQYDAGMIKWKRDMAAIA